MKILVVYYSRTGVTRKTSEALSGTLREGGHEVTVEEIREKASRRGALGWLAAGFAAMFRRPASIEPVVNEPAAFDLVAVGTPVWAWTASTPVRAFCEKHGTAAKKLAFFATMGSSGDQGAFKAMTALTGREPVATMSLIDRAVRKDDPEEFVAKVRTFAEAIGRAAESGA